MTVADDQYGRVAVAAWVGLHPKLARRGRWATADCVRHGDPGAGRAPAQAEGAGSQDAVAVVGRTRHPDLATCWWAYLRRFDLEHTFRFAKNTLGWTTPRVRTPSQADRWTWQVIAYTQLRLGGGLVADAGCPDSAACTRTGSPPPASAADIADFATPSAPQPARRNPHDQGPDAPTAAAAAPEPATQP